MQVFPASVHENTWPAVRLQLVTAVTHVAPDTGRVVEITPLLHANPAVPVEGAVESLAPKLEPEITV